MQWLGVLNFRLSYSKMNLKIKRNFPLLMRLKRFFKDIRRFLGFSDRSTHDIKHSLLIAAARWFFSFLVSLFCILLCLAHKGKFLV